MELLQKYREDLYICAQCSFCTTSCEATKFAHWESESPKGRMYVLKELFEGNLGGNSDILDELSESAFKCTLCGRCGEVCQTDIDLRSLWLDLRTNLVDRGHFPKKLSLMREGIKESGNVANYPNSERASWADFVPDAPDDLFQKENADVVYFVGCMSSFSPAISSIPESFVQVLAKSGVDFAIMGEKEMCCTYPLIVGGYANDLELTDELRKKNVDAVKSVGASTMVFTCPSCYLTWEEEYLERYGLDIKLYHSTQFVNKLIEDGNLTLADSKATISYHDPCDLGRNSNEYEAPRNVLRSAGAEIVEAEHTREMAFCCGGGGDVEVYDADLSTNMSSITTNAFDETGAKITITACQQCKRTLQKTAQSTNSEMKYMDIVEFVLDNLE